MQQDTKTPEALHELRRRLKKIIYCSRILSRASPNTAQRRWDNLGQVLGDWHDGEVIIAHLNRYMEKHDLGEAEMAVLRRVRARLRKRCREGLESIHFRKVVLN